MGNGSRAMLWAAVMLATVPATAAAAGFPNPLLQPPSRANSIYDPGVYVQGFGGAYVYFVASGGSDPAGNMPIWSSADRRTWTKSGRIIRAGRRPGWLVRGGGPQIYLLAPGKFVSYFGAVVKGRKKQCVGRAESAGLDNFNGNVPGPYLCVGRDNYSTIDPSVFRDVNGQLYLLYKDNLDAAGLGNSRLVIRTMGPSGSLARANLGPAKYALTASGGWEGDSVEAPTLVRNPADRFYYLFYSGATFSDDNYAVGVARSASPTGPFTRSPYNPILKALNDPKFCGSGHQDITYTPAEGWLIFYHAYLVRRPNSTQCDTRTPRYLMMDQLRWDRPGGWPRVHDGTPSE